MFARIFRPAKTAMQSGKSKTDNWVLEYEPSAPRTRDPLMGWTSNSDMMSNQVRLTFPTKDDAVAYARDHDLPHEVIDTAPAKRVLKTYSENFGNRRRAPWTH